MLSKANFIIRNTFLKCLNRKIYLLETRPVFLLNSINNLITHSHKTNTYIKHSILELNNSIYQPIRFKSKKSNKSTKKDDIKEDESIDDDDESDVDDEQDNDIKSIDTSDFKPGYKIVKKHVISLRFDTILSSGLNMSRNKIDDLFYGSKLRLNGEKLAKKSLFVKEGDRLDLIGEKDSKTEKRAIKRVLLAKIVSNSAGDSKKPLVILAIWKGGLYEEDMYRND